MLHYNDHYNTVVFANTSTIMRRRVSVFYQNVELTNLSQSVTIVVSFGHQTFPLFDLLWPTHFACYLNNFPLGFFRCFESGILNHIQSYIHHMF